MASQPIVVMMGGCGTGKSTMVEVLSGCTGLSSGGAYSHTKHQRRLAAISGTFFIVDTPGQDGLTGKLQDNIEVAQALNQGPVSLMLFTTKASPRLEGVIQQVERYVDRFVDFSDIICIAVTHMDLEGLEWSQKECRDVILDQFGISKVVFSGTATPPATLLTSVEQELVTPPANFSIDSGNFLNYFKISNSKVKILQSVKDKVNQYQADVKDFKDQLSRWPSNKKTDQMFQFNSFMTNEIEREKRALAEHFKWEFVDAVDGVTVEQQAGYMGQMASQMRAELFQVRTILLNYQQDAGVSVLRKCPHCGIVWGKWEGCDGATTCGARPSALEGSNVLSDFIFSRGKKGETKFSVTESSQKNVTRCRQVGAGTGYGCGKPITWSSMEPVTSGKNWSLHEIQESRGVGISVADVQPLTPAAQVSFDELYQAALKKTMQSRSPDRAAVMLGGA